MIAVVPIQQDSAHSLRLIKDRTLNVVGLRLWDVATQQSVRDGMAVSVWPQSATGLPPLEATVNAQGVYILPALPLVRGAPGSATAGAGDPAATRSALITMHDLKQRFLPVTLPLQLPGSNAAFLGGPVPGAGDQTGDQVALFSAPDRRMGPGYACVRSLLWDVQRDKPATFAVVQVTEGTNTWYGTADDRGVCTLWFPYPVVRQGLSAPANQAPQWPLRVSVCYGGTPWRLLAPSGVPDQREILRQPAAWLYPQGGAGAARTQAWSIRLTMGRELVLRTDDTPRLLVESP